MAEDGEMDLKKPSAVEGDDLKIGGVALREAARSMSVINEKQTKMVAPLVLVPDEGRLDSWKEIAVYLQREVRTAQRWEKCEGLPVRRHRHPNASSVYAFKPEIDIWLRSRRPPASESAPKEEHLECAAKSPNPTQLAAAPRMNAKSRTWLRNASAGVGSLDLLHGEERIRLYFYVQLRGEQDADSARKKSVARARE
jgi:hypothetical protein